MYVTSPDVPAPAIVARTGSCFEDTKEPTYGIEFDMIVEGQVCTDCDDCDDGSWCMDCGIPSTIPKHDRSFLTVCTVRQTESAWLWRGWGTLFCSRGMCPCGRLRLTAYGSQIASDELMHEAHGFRHGHCVCAVCLLPYHDQHYLVIPALPSAASQITRPIAPHSTNQSS